jgi:hypothetical protein
MTANDLVESMIRLAVLKGHGVSDDDTGSAFCDEWDGVRDSLESMLDEASGFGGLFIKGVIIAGDRYCGRGE